MSSATLGSGSSSSIDVELLLDRFLSSSTPTDCLDSLEKLTARCRLRRLKPDTNNEEDMLLRAKEEEEEEERQSSAIDTLLRNSSVLNSLCSLVATSTTTNSGMDVEGGNVAACELLLVLLSSPSSSGNSVSSGSASGSSSKGMTTEALLKQQLYKRRKEYISKTLLHFHDVDAIGGKQQPRSLDGTVDDKMNQLALTPSLLDCLCPAHGNANTASGASVYARVLSLQILQALLAASPGTLREQLMMAPDGINRLVDLLGRGSMMDESGSEEAIPEEVRNESILFLTSLASSSSMLARLISFSEGYDRALKIALESSTSSSSSSGILSSGSTVAIDCLELCLALANADSASRELFMGGGDGRGNLDRLAQLVDLRGGERYRDKERNFWWDNELKEKRRREMGKSVSSSATGGGSSGMQPKGGSGSSKREKKTKDDLLDDILREASSPSNKADAVQNQAKQSQQQSSTSSSVPIEEGPPTPYLTPNETKIVDLVFSLILVLLLDGDENSSSSSSSTAASTNATLSKRRGRAKVIMSHDLSRYIVDCALYTLPPPGVDYVSAVPPTTLQQKALVTMSVLGSLGDTVVSEEEAAKAKRIEVDGKEGDAKSTTAAAELRKKELDEETKLQTQLLFETMPIYLRGWVPAIDRLMYLCCTGAYSPSFQDEDANHNDDCDDERPEVKASLLSTYSIAAFRSCLPPETASRMVLHALAPPPPDETDEMGAPLEPPVVTRLVTTLADNLRFMQDQQQQDGQEVERTKLDMIEIYRATIGASGAAGALGVFLTKGGGDATREMLLRLSPLPPPRPLGGDAPDDVSGSEPSNVNLIDFILQHVATYNPASSSNDKLHASSAYVTMSLLRLLIDWVFEMPRAVAKLLSSPASVSVGVLVRSKKGENSSPASQAIPALSGLLLGLCLESMTDSDGSSARTTPENKASDVENIAWTKETIINLVQSMGVGKYLSMIDEWKRHPLPLPYCRGEERSSLEQRAFTSWYGHNVTIVRRRVVQELAGSRGDDSDESDTDEALGGAGADGKPSSSLRSLRRMVLSQSQENEDLQTKLREALLTVSTQSTLINELKLVVELGTSAETNDMLTEFTEKVAELEKVKSELTKDAENQTRLQKEAMEAKDREIELVRNELEESQNCLKDMRRDNEVLNEEMAGLSSAYHLLEQQYHNHISGDVNSASTPTEMTASGETAAEDGGARDHSSGEAAAEDPGRSSKHEMHLLLDENARLREEGRAANEWMSMAVSKMEEMSTENEILTRSLEEARNNSSMSSSNNPDAFSIQSQLDDLRLEMQAIRDESEAKLMLRDEEIAQKQELVQQLEAQVEEMKGVNSSSSNLQIQDLQQAIERQEEEMASLRQANIEAQEWMASAVAHIDKLTAEVKSKEAQLEALAALQSARNEAPATFDSTPAVDRDETPEVQSDTPHSNASSERERLEAELDQVKAENVTLTEKLNEFSSWSETAQNRLAEVEAKLQEAEIERDELKTQLEVNSPQDDDSKSHDYIQQIESLQNDIREKSEQLERMQDQLIDDAEANEARVDKLIEELDAARQRADDVSQEATSLSATVKQLSIEKEQLSKSLSDTQKAINTLTAEKNEATVRSEEAHRRISELEEAKSALEAQVNHLMSSKDQGRDDIDEQIIAITAERNSLQTQLDDITNECDEVSKSLERSGMENCNLVARNRALEQDNKSLENQFRELERKVAEKEDLLAHANDEKSTLTCELNEVKNKYEGLLREQEQAHSLETNLASLENQLKQQENESAKAIEEWEARYSTLEEAGADVVRQWQERVQALESDVLTLENQLKEQENEATKTIELWETRCSNLEESGEGVIREWEERVQLLDSDVSALENQLREKEAEAILSQEKLLVAEDSLTSKIAEAEAISEQKLALESNLASMALQIESLHEQLDEITQALNVAQAQVSDKDDALAVSERQQSDLAKALLETQNQSELVVRQWQERAELLETNISELESAIEQIKISSEETVKLWQERAQALESERENQEREAAAAISEWEARCDSLNEEIKSLELQLDANEKDNTVLELKAEVSRLAEEIEAHKSTLEKTQGHLNDATSLLSQRESEWEEKKATFTATIEQLESSCLAQQNQLEDNSSALDSLNLRCSALSDENMNLHQESRHAIDENKVLQVVVLELKEELKQAKEELQSIATDQFTHKATEMATQALRQQMEEIRARYAADQEALANEIEARRVAEENVSRLKLDLALLAQATEYDETVDVHVRKIAKKISSENVKTERKEMEELRSTLERLREEIGSCRWKERESEEKAANAHLQMSILEQEVTAAKTDMELMKQAIEELETSKINLSVSFECRIEALENERIRSEQLHNEEMLTVKAELARSIEKRDHLAHNLEQSEKTNAALVYSTAHNNLGDSHGESEVIKLQLERAQLLAQISQMGIDTERRVKEAVAAQVSSSEADLIVEKQSRRSVETSLSDALSELDEVKKKLSETRSGESAEKQHCMEDLKTSLDEMRLTNDKLTNKNLLLRVKLDTIEKEFKSTTDDLNSKLRKAEKRLRSKERESRFEAALVAEISNLRASARTDSHGNHKHSQALVLIEQNMQSGIILSDEEKKSIDRNSAYIIEMYDYVCELKSSITEEREMYKELLAEHEELLALLGQTGLNRIQFGSE
ncbi:hypothetical protein ACHAWU_003423 [Discostella pseudostelligera]|uniref:Vesicle tethering protein Uso1/P115-like head domain-containing protein n=1 Tax=Discostella pseudostelligera TaxID=259834 RepID=A0ABD3MT80_9STRA